MFCIAQAVVDSGLARRFALMLLDRAGTDSRRVVLAFMVGTAAMSTIVSDVPAAAVWMSMALPLLARIGAAPLQSQLGKALMIGIPVAAFIGGVGTPAGSSINILGLFQIEQFGKVQVSFLQWMAIGIPMVVILTPLSWWVLIAVLRRRCRRIGSVAELRGERHALGRGPAASGSWWRCWPDDRAVDCQQLAARHRLDDGGDRRRGGDVPAGREPADVAAAAARRSAGTRCCSSAA